MLNFDKCFDILMDHEIPPGGDPFEDVPGDEGGPTMYGITLPVLPSYFMGKLLRTGEQQPSSTVETLKGFTREDAKEFYLWEYWRENDYGEINSPDVAALVLLAAVNLGPNRAHYAAQRACRACRAEIVEDGIFGPKTISAINWTLTFLFLPSLRSEVAAYYRRILDKAAREAELEGLKESPKEKFREGWFKRAYFNAPA